MIDPRSGALVEPITKADLAELTSRWERLLDEKFPRDSDYKGERDYRNGADAVIRFLRSRIGDFASLSSGG